MTESLLFRLVEASNTPLIEAAHFYIEKPEEGIPGAYAAKTILEMIAGMPQPHLMLLIDDSSDPTNSAVLAKAGIDSIKKAGFNPDEIIYESGLKQAANLILAKLEASGKTWKMKKPKYTAMGNKPKYVSQNTKLAISNIDLTGKNGNPYTPSCALLDAALYLKKLEQHDFLITVLPIYLHGQQQNTKKILEALGHSNLPVFIIYHDQDGQLKEEEYWGKDG